MLPVAYNRRHYSDYNPMFNIRENVEYTLIIADVVGGFTNGNNWWDCEINGTLTSSFVGATAASGEWINTGALW
jgi:hypothetical protein